MSVPAVPALAGVAALALAGGGFLQMGNPDLASASGSASAGLSSGFTQLEGHRHASSSGTDGTDAGALDDRTATVSRDFDRSQDRAGGQQLQNQVDRQTAERNAALKSLGQAAAKQSAQLAKNRWVLPAHGYHLTARFDDSGSHWSHRHTGLDFAAPTGAPVYAVASGTIVSTQYDGAYGNKTVERLPDGTELWYCHQNEFATKPGATVVAGQTIGAIGSTGNVTGPHVHLEVRPGGGDPVDPYQALIFHGVRP